ncbi:MAG: glutamine synthetase family protein, partial [Odoribacteraceae bacterium]|nr:glutamine synthetase family protein [Odoribacteraceae bacterium]
MGHKLKVSADPLVRFLGKERRDFTKADIIRYISANNIDLLNLRYAGADGRLKTLNIVFHDLDYLDTILSSGERVDGSSLFPYIEAGASDLYVVPRYRTAFLDPFSPVPSLDILCSYYTKDGTPLETSPEYTLRKAREALKRVTGMDYEVMGELEYYVASAAADPFLADDQRGYHESAPFNKSGDLRVEAMKHIVEAGGHIKYGHSEVGNFTRDGLVFEQNEIEFLPVPLEEAADQLVIAKWILRVLAYRRGVNLTFAPKITDGKAGSGLHVHTRLKKEGRNAMIENGRLSDDALRAISGYLDLAPALTAFGNTNPASYLRLVPHQEAPTTVCWGDRNRSVLVRVPLGWT